MKKCIIVLISFFLVVEFAYCQSKADLIRSIEELKVTAIQNQTKIESLQKDVEKLKVHIVIAETKIENQEKEIAYLNQRLNGNSNNPPINGSVQNDATEPSNNVINNQSNAPAKSQCKGMTKAGSRCKRSAGSSGFCYQHGGQ
jgi:hypothetical protein